MKDKKLCGDMKDDKKEIKMRDDIILSEVVRLVEEGVSVTLPVDGRSMLPFIVGGRESAILTKPGKLKKGDVVLAWTDDRRYVLHRIISIDHEQVILRGDGNIGTELCRLSDVKGAVVGFYRKGREKLDRTDEKKWKIYSWIWTRLFPVRRYLLAFYRRIWIPVFGTV